MRFKATDPEAKNVKAVRLDGKLVTTAIEVDTDEGWIKSIVVDTDGTLLKADDTVDINADNQRVTGDGEVSFKTVQRFGKVEVLFYDNPPVDD